jgi:hypothetical protein
MFEVERFNVQNGFIGLIILKIISRSLKSGINIQNKTEKISLNKNNFNLLTQKSIVSGIHSLLIRE